MYGSGVAALLGKDSDHPLRVDIDNRAAGDNMAGLATS